MPVVRELINRIGFKVNKGDLANAENAFGKLKGRGKGLISFFGKLSKAIKGVGLALTGVATVGAVQFSKLEKDRALTRFFVTSKEQAEDLRLEMAKIRGESEVISKLEAEKATSIFSRLNLKDITKNFKDIVPILTDVSTATLKLDLPEVVSALVDFVKSGDIGQLEQFGGSVKDLAEKLSIAGFDASKLKTQEAKFKFIFEILSKNRDLFRELAKDQEKTLTFAGKRVETQFGDFFANFGENTAEPMRQLLNEIAIVMKDINNNEDFWDAVKTGAIAVKNAFVETKALIIEINKKGLLGFGKDVITKQIESGKGGDPNKFAGGELLLKYIKNILPEIDSNQTIGSPSRIFKEGEQVLQGKDPILVGMVKELVDKMDKFLQANLRPQFNYGTRKIEVVHSGNVKSDLSPLSTALNNLAAENGGGATIGNR